MSSPKRRICLHLLRAVASARAEPARLRPFRERADAAPLLVEQAKLTTGATASNRAPGAPKDQAASANPHISTDSSCQWRSPNVAAMTRIEELVTSLPDPDGCLTDSTATGPGR